MNTVYNKIPKYARYGCNLFYLLLAFETTSNICMYCKESQGSKGISQWPINLNIFSMIKHKITKSPKLLSRLIRKRYYITFGTNVINSVMSHPSLNYMLVPKVYNKHFISLS